MHSFITGSYAYGTPTKDSNIDLVVLVTSDDLKCLMNYAKCDEGYNEQTTGNFKFGNLNLIACSEINNFLTWMKGTEELIKRKPVTREEAVKLFKKLRGEV